MGLILLEALGAGIVFILIIWWTMFSGRKRGELHEEADAEDAPAPKDPSPRD
jgi:cbb3-type cytochrome oxidase subunit 3